LLLLALNVGVSFLSHITLTYHALTRKWETEGQRNLRFVQKSKADLHRFLRCIRRELGEYLWVQEFQERGVIHYHLLCTSVVTQGRAAEVWARASGQLGDGAVLKHGVLVQEVRNERGARDYLGRYVGKEKQKSLPFGVSGAGRWWGSSRALKVIVLDELVWLDLNESFVRKRELRICRDLRKYLSNKFRFKYRGGIIFDFKGETAAKLPGIANSLREHYRHLMHFTDAWAEAEWEVVRRKDGEIARAGWTDGRDAKQEDRGLGEGDRRDEAEWQEGAVEARRLADLERGRGSAGKAPQDGGTHGEPEERQTALRLFGPEPTVPLQRRPEMGGSARGVASAEAS
jgi:hypothetical protein